MSQTIPSSRSRKKAPDGLHLAKWVCVQYHFRNVWGKISRCGLNHVANERKENHKAQEEKGRRQVKVIVGCQPLAGTAVGAAGKSCEAARAPRLPLDTPSLPSLRTIASIVPSTSPSHSNPNSILNTALKSQKLES